MGILLGGITFISVTILMINIIISISSGIQILAGILFSVALGGALACSVYGKLNDDNWRNGGVAFFGMFATFLLVIFILSYLHLVIGIIGGILLFFFKSDDVYEWIHVSNSSSYFSNAITKASRIESLRLNGARCENCSNHSSSCYGLPNPCSLYEGPHNV